MAERQSAPSDPRSQVPHFSLLTVDGRHVHYADLWQHRNLVFVSIDPQRGADSERYATTLRSRSADFEAAEASLVVTAEAIDGLPSPGIVIAGRWGEIIHTFTREDGGSVTAAPDPP